MSLMNNSDSGTCDLLEQAIRELNELNNCNKTQQDPVLIENETHDIEIIEIFPPRVVKCNKGNQTETVTPPHVSRKMSEKKKIAQQKNVVKVRKKHARNDSIFNTKPDISWYIP